MYEYSATAISNYDADTAKLRISLGFGIYHETAVRLIGIDTPELKSGDYRELAKQGRDWLTEKLRDQALVIRTYKHQADGSRDKYGRILADIFVVGEVESVSAQLLDRSLAVPYGGGKKDAAAFADLVPSLD